MSKTYEQYISDEIKKDCKLIEHLSDTDKTDAIMTEVIAKDPSLYNYVTPTLWGINAIKKAIDDDCNNIKKIPIEKQTEDVIVYGYIKYDDNAIVLFDQSKIGVKYWIEKIKASPNYINAVPTTLRTPDFIKQMVTLNDKVYDELPETERTKELSLILVNKDGLSVTRITNLDEEICTQAIKQNSFAYYLLPQIWKDNDVMKSLVGLEVKPKTPAITTNLYNEKTEVLTEFIAGRTKPSVVYESIPMPSSTKKTDIESLIKNVLMQKNKSPVKGDTMIVSSTVAIVKLENAVLTKEQVIEKNTRICLAVYNTKWTIAVTKDEKEEAVDSVKNLFKQNVNLSKS